MRLARLAELREQFKASIDADAESFNEVMAAFKKAKDHPEAQAEVEAATKKATLVPLVVAERAREVRQIVESLRPITNPKMASDLTVGVSLARAAVEGALANVEINLAISRTRLLSRMCGSAWWRRVVAVDSGSSPRIVVIVLMMLRI